MEKPRSVSCQVGMNLNWTPSDSTGLNTRKKTVWMTKSFTSFTISYCIMMQYQKKKSELLLYKHVGLVNWAWRYSVPVCMQFVIAVSKCVSLLCWSCSLNCVSHYCRCITLYVLSRWSLILLIICLYRGLDSTMQTRLSATPSSRRDAQARFDWTKSAWMASLIAWEDGWRSDSH